MSAPSLQLARPLLARLVPAEPDPGRDRAWTLGGSVLLHLAVFAILLGIAARRPPVEPSTPSYDLIFEENASPAPGSPAQALPPAQAADVPLPDDSLPGPPAPLPSSVPSPDGVPSPDRVPSPLPEAAVSAPAPAPASTQPTAPEDPASAAPMLAFAPPAPEPARPAPPPATVEVVPAPGPPPAVRLQTPREEPAPAEQAPIMPVPPPPLPPQRQTQAQPPRPRPQPRAPPGTLAAPMDLSFGPAAPPPARAARGSVASRAIDLSPGPPREGADRSDPYFQIHAANASADWDRALRAYWLRHRYYPSQAVENGDQGTVVLEMTVNRYGKVEAIEVASRSGSAWLDMAALGTFRGAQLPPLPSTQTEEHITVSVTYVLVRR